MRSSRQNRPHPSVYHSNGGPLYIRVRVFIDENVEVVPRISSPQHQDCAKCTRLAKVKAKCYCMRIIWAKMHSFQQEAGLVQVSPSKSQDVSMGCFDGRERKWDRSHWYHMTWPHPPLGKLGNFPHQDSDLSNLLGNFSSKKYDNRINHYWGNLGSFHSVFPPLTSTGKCHLSK